MTNTNGLTLVGGGRVSTKDQADSGTSLDKQDEYIRAYCERIGAKCHSVIAEDIAGDTPLSERPKQRRINDMLRDGIVRGVVWFSPDRFSRDELEGRLQIRRWLRAGYEVHFTDLGRIVDENDPRLVFNLMGAEAQKKWIVKWTTEGKQRKVKNGHIVASQLPFWLVKDGNGGAKLADECKVKLARRIHRAITVARMTLGGVAAMLNAEGIPSPRGGKWSPTTIARIVGDESLYGMLVYGKRAIERVRGEVTRGGRPKLRYIRRKDGDPNLHRIPVPPIVTRGEWQKGKAILLENKADADRNAKNYRMLRSLIECVECKYKWGGGASDHPQYRCPKCRRAHSKPLLDAWVWGEVVKLMTDPAEWEAAIQEAYELDRAQHEPRRQRLDEVNADIKDAEREADAIGRALVKAKGIVKRSLEQQQDALNERYDRLTTRKAEIEAELSNALTDDDIADMRSYREDVQAGIDVATDEDKHDMLRTLGAKISIDADTIMLTLNVGKPKTIARDELVNATSQRDVHNIIIRRMIERAALADEFVHAMQPRAMRQTVMTIR